MASWTQRGKEDDTEEEIESSDHVGPLPVEAVAVASSSTDGASGQRFSGMAQMRETKYGRCRRCGVAMRLHLLRSGRQCGQIWSRCGNFWNFKEDGRTRKCWEGQPYNGPVPNSMLSQQKRMKADVGWQVKHGPQTKRGP